MIDIILGFAGDAVSFILSLFVDTALEKKRNKTVTGDNNKNKGEKQ